MSRGEPLIRQWNLLKTLQAFHFPLLGHDARRGNEIEELDLFMLRLFNLFIVGRHLIQGAAVDDGYFFGAQAKGSTGGIEGHVSAADHGHFLTHVDLLAEIDPAEEFDSGKDTDRFLSGFHLTRIDSRGVGAGARFHVDIPLLGLWMDTTIVEVEAPHRIIERGCGGRANRIAASTVWELTEGPGSLTHVRVSFWTEPANHLDRAREALGMATSRYERRWREALRRLRDELESGAAAERLAVAGGNRYATGVP